MKAETVATCFDDHGVVDVNTPKNQTAKGAMDHRRTMVFYFWLLVNVKDQSLGNLVQRRTLESVLQYTVPGTTSNPSRRDVLARGIHSAVFSSAKNQSSEEVRHTGVVSDLLTSV